MTGRFVASTTPPPKSQPSIFYRKYERSEAFYKFKDYAVSCLAIQFKAYLFEDGKETIACEDESTLNKFDYHWHEYNKRYLFERHEKRVLSVFKNLGD